SFRRDRTAYSKDLCPQVAAGIFFEFILLPESILVPECKSSVFFLYTFLLLQNTGLEPASC
ncbi:MULTISPECIES: hypothetical protein, partial [unclassified Arsukibacterium]|uniref:hypothetical protein n=1 Tax=unclassified Arsukibacterium TaxID=2635278 RepID=UPI0025C0A31F